MSFDEIKCHAFLQKAQTQSASEALVSLAIDFGVQDDHDMFIAMMEMVLQLNDRLGYLERKDRNAREALSDLDVNHPGRL